MAMKRTRQVRGIGRLNRAPEAVALPDDDFLEFCALQDKKAVAPKAISYAWCRTGRMQPPPANPVRFVGIIDNPDGDTDESFFPIGWAYKRVMEREPKANRELDRQFSRNGLNCEAYVTFEYLSEEHGLTLLLTQTRLIDRYGQSGFVTRTTTGESVIIPQRNVFGIQESDTPGGSSYFYTDLSDQHARFAYLVSQYKQTFGYYPRLFPAYQQACIDQAANMRPVPRERPLMAPPPPPPPPSWGR